MSVCTEIQLDSLSLTTPRHPIRFVVRTTQNYHFFDVAPRKSYECFRLIYPSYLYPPFRPVNLPTALAQAKADRGRLLVGCRVNTGLLGVNTWHLGGNMWQMLVATGIWVCGMHAICLMFQGRLGLNTMGRVVGRR